MSNKSAGSKSATKVVEKSESSQPKPHLFLDQLDVNVTGTIVVMIGRVWDVNAITRRYLSTDFVVSDSKHDMFMLEFDAETTTRKVSADPFDVTGYVTNVGRTSYKKSSSKTLDFYLANQRGQSLRLTLWGGLGLKKDGTTHPVVMKSAEKVLPNNMGNGYARYMLEVVVADDIAHVVIVMFNDTLTELLKCSAESLMGVEDEGVDADDDSNLPTAIRNLIGTTHVLEIKSHTYYEYGTFESFTCWKINPSDLVEDGASSSMPTLTADHAAPSMKRLARHPTVCTPLKPNEEKKKRVRTSELEDSDVDEVCGPAKERNACNIDGALDKKKKRKRYIEDDFESAYLPNFHQLTLNSVNEGDHKMSGFAAVLSVLKPERLKVDKARGTYGTAGAGFGTSPELIDEGVPAELTGTGTARAGETGLSTRGDSRTIESTKDTETGKIRLLIVQQLIWGFVMASVNERSVLGLTDISNNFCPQKHQGLRKYQHGPSSLNESTVSSFNNVILLWSPWN
nr:hypothetical protein [Tanacetum cinerariifolium]